MFKTIQIRLVSFGFPSLGFIWLVLVWISSFKFRI